MPSQVDFWAVNDVLDLLKEARIYKDIKACFLLNQMQPNTLLSKEAKEVIDGFDADVKPLETVINARIAFKKSFGEGKGAVEWTDPKAKEEITNLYNEILSLR
jgi:chromosome partitioning protein